MENAGDAYRAFAAAVLGYLRSQRAPDPEDILGEVFLQVARDWSKFRGDEAALRRWVFSVAYNRLLDARRAASRRPLTSSSPIPEGSRRDSAAGLDAELLAALAELTPEQREVVVLRFVGDLPLEDVARITRRRVGAVKAMQRRALEALERSLGSREH
ncbi:MAG TPA: sigma-70 family RNA polymerase sigma factor [Acidimicrobiales bacterium]|nr:sigma-70 family RNA polymerase sigma factor [Acidimicrobiales bacterium]